MNSDAAPIAATKTLHPRRFTESIIVGAILIGAFATSILLRPSAFAGPDSRTFLAIAAHELQAGSWSDPRAFSGDFDGNFWSVGYPTFVALLQRVGGGLEVVEFVQILMGTSLALFTWQLTRHLGRAVRLTATAVVAFSPPVLWMAHNAGYEILLSWLMVLSLTALWGAGGLPVGPSAWRAWGACLTAGFAAGGALLTQSKALAVIPILLWLAWKWGKRGPWVFLAGLMAALIPWMVRNAVVLGTPSPFTTNGPYNLWLANNPAATTGGYLEPAPTPAGGAGYLQGALEFMISQPETTVTLLSRRMMRLLEPVYLSPDLGLPPQAHVLLHFATAGIALIVTLGFLAYLFGRLWAKPPVLPIVGALAGFVTLYYLAHLPFIAEARYMAPAYPVVVAVAGPTLAFLVRRWRPRDVAPNP